MNSLLYHYANHLNASSTHCLTEVFPLSGICSCLVISVIRELTLGLHRKVTARTVVHTLNGLAGTAVIGQLSGVPCFFPFFCSSVCIQYNTQKQKNGGKLNRRRLCARSHEWTWGGRRGEGQICTSQTRKRVSYQWRLIVLTMLTNVWSS